MKKFLLMAVMAIMTLGASAQTQKWYAGGQLTLGRTTTELSGVSLKSTQIAVLPEIGYNVTDNFALGAIFGVDYRKTGDSKLTTFNINPYARATYFRSGMVDLFVDGGVGFGIGRANGHTAVTYEIGFRPGVALNLSEKFSLVAHVGFLGYESANRPAKRNGAPENWGLNLDSTDLMFGFYYHF
ncbi:outer membrane beta-barrel protein [uncultured Duncaniella sp.]|uniref:outer membrane beta-barrel protein n=1 Tax=uncultured Duncaniella sp. TaxID=2768039 RepID=UPI0026302F51|nr:outer membrane beta-barrel protein [uncultured Duncaniella sp.]